MKRWIGLTIVVLALLRIALVDKKTRASHPGQPKLSGMICLMLGDRSTEYAGD